jgi:hypothetical protein
MERAQPLPWRLDAEQFEIRIEHDLQLFCTAEGIR